MIALTTNVVLIFMLIFYCFRNICPPLSLPVPPVLPNFLFPFFSSYPLLSSPFPLFPLFLGLIQGDKEIVEALLHANANPSIVSDNNETAYSLAVASGRQLVALIIAESTVVRRRE